VNLKWYRARLARMSASEVFARVVMTGRQQLWSRGVALPRGDRRCLPVGRRIARIGAPSLPDTASTAPSTRRTIEAADRLLAGHWCVFDVALDDFTEPDWFRDPLTGSRAPHDRPAFQINYRDEATVGNVKHLWEASRHNASTVLAAAWWLSRDDRYAERASAHLGSWWAANPFPQGVHWTSAYEAALRLIAWSWVRALLGEWSGCPSLFEENDAFIEQLYAHQNFVAAFHSRGSSRNNHVMTELAGIAMSAVAFPWFPQSADWADWGYRGFAEEADLQTADDGLNREHAADYHRLVLELIVAGTIAAELSDRHLPPIVYEIGTRMADGLAAMLDVRGQPPRYGDADDGHILLVDAPEADRCATVLSAAGVLFGAADWWPRAARADSTLAQLTGSVRQAPPERLAAAPARAHFPQSGQTIMRTDLAGDEIWLRCDHARLGYLALAAHGHADSLSIEYRIDGTPIFIDPGTYCYHGEEIWRRYFKSTLAHNTLTLDGADQAGFGGPFLWLTATRPELESLELSSDADRWHWQARHDGYRRLSQPATHHRRVELDRRTGDFEISDWLEGDVSHEVALSFHLGPTVVASLDAAAATLDCGDGRMIFMQLPEQLSWTAQRGETAPPLGWISRRFGQREPTTTLLGRGSLEPGRVLKTNVTLRLAGPSIQ
jgi:hypothetical protein